MKICFKCQKSKSISEFYAAKKMKDGRLGKCMECTRMDVVINRVQNLDRYQKYDRDRQNNPERVIQRLANSKRRTRLFPTRRKANAQLRYAIKSGKLVRQPCEVCGNKKVDAHHDDYSKPLEVRWLCSMHHHATHRKYDYDAILKSVKSN